MDGLLITGTDTDVGKTWVAALLLRHLNRYPGLRVGAWKPLCSGAQTDSDGALYWGDVEALRQACDGGLEGRPVPVDQICRQRFMAPLAPYLAARQEGRRIDGEDLATGYRRWDGLCDGLVVEGAGGLMCPMSDTRTLLELATEWQFPCIIVAANRLGMMNHTLLTARVAESAGLTVLAVVVNDVTAAEADISQRSNARELAAWLPETPVLHCAHHDDRLTVVSSGNTVFESGAGTDIIGAPQWRSAVSEVFFGGLR